MTAVSILPGEIATAQETPRETCETWDRDQRQTCLLAHWQASGTVIPTRLRQPVVAATQRSAAIDAVHEHGTKNFVQLFHAGHYDLTFIRLVRTSLVT